MIRLTTATWPSRIRGLERNASTLPGSGILPLAYTPAAWSHHCQALPASEMPESLRANGTQEMPPPRATCRHTAWVLPWCNATRTA